MMYYVEILYLLLAGHYLADFALQSDSMGRGKNRNRVDHSLVPPGAKPAAIWPYWMTAHASVHSLFVYMFTGVFALAILELIAHWTIDFFKCENKLTVHQDQALHVGCKVLWVVLLWLGS